jgi:hypothetical protein
MATREEVFAQRLLAKADKILADVDEAYIIQQRGHCVRRMPKFRPEELSLGKTLGTGGFGIVSEITKFTLDPDHKDEEETQRNGNSIVRDGVRSELPDNPQQACFAGGEGGFLNVRGSTYKISDQHEELSINDHIHYDFRKGRLLIKKRCMRKGVARFALKRLHGALTAVERARGMIDLAVEAKYLSVVWHPNISEYTLRVLPI